MELVKCSKCGGTPEIDFTAVVEFGSSGAFQDGWVECKNDGKYKYCHQQVCITFDADSTKTSRTEQLTKMWNILNEN